MDELKKLMAEAQTDEPWSVVWYGDEHLPAIAIHRTAEDRICFMPTIQHPADGVQFEANAALIVAAVNALPELLERVRRLEESLKRMLLEFDFLVESDNLPDIRDDMIFAQARAALNQEGGQ